MFRKTASRVASKQEVRVLALVGSCLVCLARGRELKRLACSGVEQPDVVDGSVERAKNGASLQPETPVWSGKVYYG